MATIDGMPELLFTVLAEEQHIELFMPPWAFGLIAFGILCLLGLLTFSFRNVSEKGPQQSKVVLDDDMAARAARVDNASAANRAEVTSADGGAHAADSVRD